MRPSARLGTWSGALALALGAIAAPAHATHVNNAVVTQIENLGQTVTVQFDVNFNASPTSGQMQFGPGDGRDAIMSDGVVGGSYAGNASGTTTFGGFNPGGTTYSWTRTSPAANVSRTRVTFSYASLGTYQMTWQVCGNCVSGVLTVWATGSSWADCTMNPFDPVNSITYTPPITSPLIPQNIDFELDVVLECTGSAPAAGTYHLNITGESAETCMFGESVDATVVGTKLSSNQPLAATGGRWGHHRETLHLFGYPDPARPTQSGEFYLGSSTTRYQLNLWLDLPVASAACPLAGGQLSNGHATIIT